MYIKKIEYEFIHVDEVSFSVFEGPCLIDTGTNYIIIFHFLKNLITTH